MKNLYIYVDIYHIYINFFQVDKKEQNHVIWRKMDKTKDHYIQLNRQDLERQMSPFGFYYLIMKLDLK